MMKLRVVSITLKTHIYIYVFHFCHPGVSKYLEPQNLRLTAHEFVTHCPILVNVRNFPVYKKVIVRRESPNTQLLTGK